MDVAEQRPIALVGLMGAGKSRVARLLGERLGVAVVDLDAMVEADSGCTVAELFARGGEADFRRREGEALARALAAGAGVLACGGGIVLEAAHRRVLRARCRTVWLEVDPAVAARRLETDRTPRPLLASESPRERLAALLGRRAPLYAEVASARVVTDSASAEEVADAVLEALSRSAC